MTTVAADQTVHLPPGRPGSAVGLQHRYENFVGGDWTAPTGGRYRANRTPITGRPFCEVPESSFDDVEVAVAAASAAQRRWSRSSPAKRAAVLDAIADRIDGARESLAVAESWDNGKPVREAMEHDLPAATAHIRRVAALARGERDAQREVAARGGRTGALQGAVREGGHALRIRRPLGVVAQVLPFNYPLLAALWDLAPALAAGNCSILKPARATPWSLLKLVEQIGDVVPAGTINVLNGEGRRIGRQLASSPDVATVAFAGEASTGRQLLHQAAERAIPTTVDLGGTSANIVFADVLDDDDALSDAALEALLLFAFNKGEACMCPSRALVQESIYDAVLERTLDRVVAIRQGDPLDGATQLGPQVSARQLERVANYVRIGMREGAELLVGAAPPQLPRELRTGCFYAPTVLEGRASMRVFREQLFGPVLTVASFRDEQEAVELANGLPDGLAAGVWSRDRSRGVAVARALDVRRAWVNCYRVHPAQAPADPDLARRVATDGAVTLLDRFTAPKDVLDVAEPAPMGLF